MDKFTIKANFRRYTAFLKNTNVQSEAPTAVITLITHRCNVESILSSMNVEEYQIVDCSNNLQIMTDTKKIPAHYYQPIGSKHEAMRR